MTYCDRSDIESVFPGITDGISDPVLDALCFNASKTIDHFVLAPVSDSDGPTLTRAAAEQVVAYLQTGDLQNYGLSPGKEIRINDERLTVGQVICEASKFTLASEGLTTPWGV